MKARQIKGNIILIIVAAIWGLAFVAQDKAAEAVDSFTLNAIRSLIATICLIPVAVFMSKKTKRPLLEASKEDRAILLKSGLLCGILLCIAVNLQQFGIALYPEAAAASGRSGFITAMYVILVPLVGIIFHNRAGLKLWLGGMMSLIGMYLLCFGRGISGLYLGDLIIICCAFAFTFQIISIDKYRDRVDGVKLSIIQFAVTSVISFICMFIFEEPDIGIIAGAWKQLLYLGAVSSGIGYTGQIIGQQMSGNPTLSSILMSLESVFAAFFGVLIMGEQLSARETIGCAIMFAAIILAQIPNKKSKRQDA